MSNTGLTIQSRNNFSYVKGNSIMSIPVSQFNEEIPLQNNQLNLNIANQSNNVLIQGTLPFTLTCYTQLTFTLNSTSYTYYLPLVGDTLYPINATINLYKNSHSVSNLIYTVQESINNPINPVVTKLPETPTATNMITYLNGIQQIVTLDTIAPFQWVDPITSTIYSSCTLASTNQVIYLVYIEINPSIPLSTPLDLNAGLPTLSDIEETLTSVDVGASNVSFELVTNLVLNSNYSVTAEEVTE